MGEGAENDRLAYARATSDLAVREMVAQRPFGVPQGLGGFIGTGERHPATFWRTDNPRRPLMYAKTSKTTDSRTPLDADYPSRRRIRLVAYGARLESVLG
ncbi:MAG: hypothetical protein RL441_188 [Actinomycetota bacterium]